MNIHYNDPSLCITCIMCNENQHNSRFRFKNFKCRFCIYLHRYRYTHTKDNSRNLPEDLT